MLGRAKQFSATGDIAANEVILRACILTPGTAASSAVIREGGSGGTVVLTLTGVANGSAIVVDTPFAVRSPHLTLAGTGALFSVVM
jgi:hypothetical protein